MTEIQPGSFRRHAASLALLCAPAGCGGGRSEPLGSHTVTIEGVRGGVTIERGGLRIEVDGARFDQVRRLGPGMAVEEKTTVEGHPLSLEGGKLRLGDRDYGAVGEGDVVRLTQEGVIVNGVSRGRLPPPLSGR